jgi:hypothetical protein
MPFLVQCPSIGFTTWTASGERTLPVSQSPTFIVTPAKAGTHIAHRSRPSPGHGGGGGLHGGGMGRFHGGGFYRDGFCEAGSTTIDFAIVGFSSGDRLPIPDGAIIRTTAIMITANLIQRRSGITVPILQAITLM